jgi:hypothetical protein
MTVGCETVSSDATLLSPTEAKSKSATQITNSPVTRILLRVGWRSTSVQLRVLNEPVFRDR